MPNDSEFERDFYKSYEHDPDAGFAAESDIFAADPPPRRIGISWRPILGIAAIALIATPIVIAVNEIQTWRAAPTTVGKVVETRPEGPFPDVMTIEYRTSDMVLRRVEIGWNYTTARKVGEEVDLVYLPDAPDSAMTPVQSQDQGWSVSPFVLFGSAALGMLCLSIAFPNHIRVPSRSNKR